MKVNPDPRRMACKCKKVSDATQILICKVQVRYARSSCFPSKVELNFLCAFLFAALKPENIAMTMRSFIPMGITAMIENFIGNVNIAAEGPHLLQVTNYLCRVISF